MAIITCNFNAISFGICIAKQVVDRKQIPKEEADMKKLINTIDNIFIAISFAEEGELAFSQTVLNSNQQEEEHPALCKTA